jgi:hypothetical protein
MREQHHQPEAKMTAPTDPVTMLSIGGTPDWSAPAAAVEADPISAFTVGATGLVEAWRGAGDLSGTVEMPGMFGPEVEVPEDAPAYDRLAGFFGHHAG